MGCLTVNNHGRIGKRGLCCPSDEHAVPIPSVGGTVNRVGDRQGDLSTFEDGSVVGRYDGRFGHVVHVNGNRINSGTAREFTSGCHSDVKGAGMVGHEGVVGTGNVVNRPAVGDVTLSDGIRIDSRCSANTDVGLGGGEDHHRLRVNVDMERFGNRGASIAIGYFDREGVGLGAGIQVFHIGVAVAKTESHIIPDLARLVPSEVYVVDKRADRLDVGC